MGVFLLHLRIVDRQQAENDECCGKYRHGNIQHHVYVLYFCLCGHYSYQRAYKHRSECAGQRVYCSSYQIQLVSSVASSTEQVYHWVDHGVEHTDRESAYKGSCKINGKSTKSHSAQP